MRPFPKALPDIVSRELAHAQVFQAADAAIFDELSSHGFTESELFELVVPRRTLARRRLQGRLSAEESDRAVRLARLTELAVRVFGDAAKAHRWLRKPSRTLAESVPLMLMKTETGGQLVEQTLHRIEYGMLA